MFAGCTDKLGSFVRGSDSFFKDPDPSVLTFTLQTLNVILEAEGGIVINGNMAKYLVRRIDGGGMPGKKESARSDSNTTRLRLTSLLLAKY